LEIAPMTNAEDPVIDDEIIATLSDYLDGVLTGDRKTDVEAKIAGDPEWQRAHAELRETRDALSGLQKARAPETFAQDVTSTIHKRSAGRFFARRTFGDRIPLGVLLIIGLITLAIIAFYLWSSPTGSLKRAPEKPVPTQPEGVVPTP
jgi:anti-sigma factor RsiW